ncbi:lysophospholipid acyltransferase family protein [Rhodoferax sp.]|uniref:lysophospholipid acyltransferase family protein n=1 Tax=Rhodoferax sp. TaxID=50421 RepID=UPI00271C58B5|nr:lysophospholipid acyltransferase family protein [Rhodoferax sp.]MDO9144941.1 lysophospholipid acyltransferase family protein [Rhodoferax sp.]MDP1530773.1 lysophospholipid acyltransferase family protein [Rhodoferax sp.]MDP1942403.1 lysophospholipid acyltransferase family protein [Rhodoferax sp.]MDP2441963.1 lysophospholipid acyltransferase family protein [Rhodoferax sp.]MDP3192737.1 lysophospholipid acyltransferase family protein [Rhodoferax sp.]
MIILFKLLSVWPLWLLHGLGVVLGWLAILTSSTYRQRFVRHAGLAGLTRYQLLKAVGESGKMVLELPRLWLGPQVTVTWDGAEHVEGALAQGRGLVFLTPHLGCFEIAAQAYAQRFGQMGKPVTVLFRPPRQKWFMALMVAARQRPGLQTAPTNLSGVKQLIKALKKGDTVGLLPDQVPPRGMGVMAPFFGREAYTMTLSVRLVQQTGASVLLAWGERLPFGRGYRVHVRPLAQPLPTALPEAVTVINHAMETLVLQCPQQYLWGYARYKQPRTSA